MKFIGYLFFRLAVFGFWLMPFPILYLHSSFLYFVLFKVFKYRKTVVINNLKNSFPEKSEKEINEITLKFYKHLADITVESIKGLSMSKESLIKRYKVENPELLKTYFDKGLNLIGVGSHYNNWEWGVLSFSLQFPHKSIGLYKPLSNQFIDRYIKRKRAEWGMHLKSIYKTSELFKEEHEKPVIYIMVGDQSPSNTKKAYRIDFLNQDTACLHGIENYSRQNNLPVIYGDVQKLKRGYYSITLTEIIDSPGNFSEGEITKKYMQTLENIIKKQAEFWLWSHKRWKEKKY